MRLCVRLAAGGPAPLEAATARRTPAQRRSRRSGARRRRATRARATRTAAALSDRSARGHALQPRGRQARVLGSLSGLSAAGCWDWGIRAD